MKIWKPTRQEIIDAAGKIVPDVIRPGLNVLFCGINPGLYTAAVGHHFARPGNRFWPALHKAGFTNRLLSPFEERELLPLGYGVTNIVARATASAEALSREEILHGCLCRRCHRSRLRELPQRSPGQPAYRLQAQGRHGRRRHPHSNELTGAASPHRIPIICQKEVAT